MSERTCNVPDCEKPTRSGRADLCKMHYHRQYRHGSVTMQANQSGVTVSLGRRYRTVYRPAHPLASKDGVVYVHRMVLHDEIGPGPHGCHWCGREIDWLPKGFPDAIQADHVNGKGDDNRPENLVPACGRCNSARGVQARADALRDAGFWSRHDTVAALTSGGRAHRVA